MDLDTETFVVAEPVSTSEGWTPSNSEGQPHNIIAFDRLTTGSDRSRVVRAGDYTGALSAGRDHEAVAFKASHYMRGKDGAPSDVYPPLSADADKGDQDPVIQTSMGVRRLTPVETERLQGFPDGWTEFTADGRAIPDSHRYRLMGNAVATVCAQWIGHRLVAVDAMMRQQEEGT
jgi:site-specific DNA-cytosine methylase